LFKKLRTPIQLLSPYLFIHFEAFSRTILACVLTLGTSWSLAWLPKIARDIANSIDPSIQDPFTFFLISFIAFYSLLWALGKMTFYIQDLLFYPVINHAIKEITFKLLQQYYQTPKETLDQFATGKILSQIKRISSSLRNFYRTVLLNFFPKILSFFFILLSLWQARPLIYSVVITLSLSIAFFIAYPGIKGYLKTRKKAWEITDEAFRIFFNSLLNSQFTKFTCNEVAELNQLNKILEEEKKIWEKNQSYKNKFHLGLLGLHGIFLFSNLVYTLYFLKKEAQFSVGEWVMMQGYLLTLYQFIGQFVIQFRQVGEALFDFEKVEQFLMIPAIQKNQFQTNWPKKGSIQIKNLSFSHASEPPLLKNISLEIPLHQKIGIIGETGAGKTTLLSLITGFYKPQIGSICVNEIPIQEFGKHMSIVPQEIRLFEESLIDNLKRANTLASSSEIHSLIQLLHISHLCTRKNLGELGSQISGGEKQRVAWARALIKNPALLIFDEPTNHIDKKTKEILKTILKDHLKEKTVIIVSHSLELIQDLDQVFVLHHGHISKVSKNL